MLIEPILYAASKSGRTQDLLKFTFTENVANSTFANLQVQVQIHQKYHLRTIPDIGRQAFLLSGDEHNQQFSREILIFCEFFQFFTISSTSLIFVSVFY